MDCDDDPVIKEIPVYISQTLADKLFTFQYPIRPAAEGYSNAKFLKTSIKPENQEVQLEVAIDTNSVTYDQSRGEQIALNADGPYEYDEDDTAERAFDSHVMNKTVLRSSRAVPDCSTYAIGIFQDEELHITPLKGILQLRPQFNYLDKDEKTGKNETNKKSNDHDEEEEAKQVNVSFARQKSEFSKKMRDQSYQQYAKKVAEEQWIHTEYRDPTTSQAELTRLDMFCPTTEVAANNLKLSCQDYLKVLAPLVKTDHHSKCNIPAHGNSLNYIRTLPLLDQVRIIMKDAKIISFTQLRSIIFAEHDTGAILKYLQQVAVLVQGNWIVNSELIYPKDTTSQSGIASELMCRARDYILLSFTEHEYVDRKMISAVIKLPPEDIKEIFENLAHSKAKKGWKLILPSNTEFASRHPEIAQRQDMFWEAKRKHLKELMVAQSHPAPRQRKKSNRESTLPAQAVQKKTSRVIEKER